MAEIAGSEKWQGLHLACFRSTAIESKKNSLARPPKTPVKCESQARGYCLLSIFFSSASTRPTSVTHRSSEDSAKPSKRAIARAPA
jgi:hypothetical protein